MIYAGIVLLCILVFLRALPGPVRLHDDQASIVAFEKDFRNPKFRVWYLSYSSRSLYDWVNRLNYRWCGFRPAGWHLVNFILHATASCALLHLGYRLGIREAEFIAVAFAVHPIQTASVCYISGRGGILAAILLLFFAHVYLWSFPWNLASPIPLMLAYTAREDSIMALAWMPLLEWFR